MTSIQINSTDQDVEITLGLLPDLFKGEVLEKVGVRLWDGTTWPDDKPHPTTLVLESVFGLADKLTQDVGGLLQKLRAARAGIFTRHRRWDLYPVG